MDREQDIPGMCRGTLNEERGSYTLDTYFYFRYYRRTDDAHFPPLKRLMANGFACMSAYLPENDFKANAEQQWALMELLREEETRYLDLIDVWQTNTPEGEREATQLTVIPFRPGAMEADAFAADAARRAKYFGIRAYLLSPPGEGSLYRMEWSDTAKAYVRVPVPDICCDSVEQFFFSIRRGLGKDVEGWRHLFGGHIYPSGSLHAMALAHDKYEYVLWNSGGINVDHAPTPN